MFITLMFVCAAFGLFIILNWKYISNPDLQFRNVISEAIFTSGKGELAIIPDWGFYYPWAVVCFLIYLQSVSTIYLLTKKNLELSRKHWALFIAILIFFMFLPILIEYFESLFNSKALGDLEYYVDDFVTVGLIIFTIFLFFTSLILFFVRRFKNYKTFFAISFFTVLLNLFFLYSFIELFFD